MPNEIVWKKGNDSWKKTSLSIETKKNNSVYKYATLTLCYIFFCSVSTIFFIKFYLFCYYCCCNAYHTCTHYSTLFAKCLHFIQQPPHFYAPLFKFPTNEHTTQINIHIVIQVYTFVSLLVCMCAMFYICIGQYPLNVMLSHLLHTLILCSVNSYTSHLSVCFHYNFHVKFVVNYCRE